ncbi:uncharacterized protein Bfra_005005 [Botrytis fragariae]|uniref:F-box domain-containing protein n=1 Tax=Botrytis fragariae TaxID=1964551 RepID=A0A8H6EIJ3_9HELO|nr:uncharacterized protein Bfra_005005 [Botrytis fragariae]KAF5873542.1 hypothetical protein Bfra_005005 [Botrytis fragariae]
MNHPSSREDITTTTKQDSKSTTPDEKIDTTVDASHSLSRSSLNQIMDCTVRDTLSSSPVEIKELKGALISIPQEIRDMIYSYLLVNPVLGQAASVSSETTYGSTQKYNLETAILYVCKQTYQEGISILYKNPIFIDCSNSPGDWEFIDGVFDESLEVEEDERNGILEPCIINLCPLTRYTNWQPKEHQDKPLFRDTPNIEKVENWNVLLNSFEPKCLSSNAFAEFCISVYRYPNVSLNISILPMIFHEWQTDTEAISFVLDGGLVNNLLPLKMVRNIKRLVIKCAEIPVIPDYCYDRDHDRKLWPADLSVPDLPSPELISEYVKLTSGATPIIECVTLLGERLKEYFWLFHRAEFVVINREFAGLRRSIRVYDISIRPPEAVGGGLVIQEDEQSFLDCGELVEAIRDPSLEHTETAEDVLRFKQYRKELLGVLEPEYQNIRACSIKFREFLQSESGPTGVFVIGPSRAVDPLDYWTRVTRAMEVLEYYEYSFARGNTEKLRLSLAEKNKYFVLAYDSVESGKVMKKMAWAYERRMWKKLMLYYKIAIGRMEKHYFKIRWCRKDLFKWDISDRGSDLDTHSDVVEAIVWPKPESNAQLDREHIIEISKGETSDEDLEYSPCLGQNGDDDDDDDAR